MFFLHVSWGTKGQDKHTHASENSAKPRVSVEDQLKIFRTKTILAYATINMAIVVVSGPASMFLISVTGIYVFVVCCSCHGIWTRPVALSSNLWYSKCSHHPSPFF